MNIMPRLRRFSLAAGVAAVVVSSFGQAMAQEPTESHLAAARDVIAAVGATDAYDAILPAAAQALKSEMINKDPNLQDIIIATVDESTLTLASRRRDLELEAARAYAKIFTEEELKTIAAFYQSPVGLKFKSEAPFAVREVTKAAQIWQNGVARDLAQDVGKKIAAIAGASGEAAGAKPAGEAAPAEGAPAEGAPAAEKPAEEKPAEEAPKP